MCEGRRVREIINVDALHQLTDQYILVLVYNARQL
jgi:hypothetical protein